MTLTLVYEHSPGVFDSIVDKLACSDQIQLRLVCQAFRKVVDKALTRHLILIPNGEKISVQGTAHRVPQLKALDPNKPLKLPETRHVDVRGYFPPSVDLTLLKNSFPALEVLRMTTSRGRWKSYTPYVPLCAHTLVVFTNTNGFDCNPAPRSMWGGHNRTAHLPPRVKDELPESFRKIVINMNGDDIPVTDMWRAVHRAPPHVEEVVIVIPRYASLDDPGSLGTFNEAIVGMDIADLIVGAPHGLLGQSSSTAVKIPSARFTIIGLEAVPVPDYAQHFRAVLREHLSANRFDDIVYDDGGPTVVHGNDGPIYLPVVGDAKVAHNAKVDSILAKVEMITKHEYVHRVGRDIAVLELVEKLEENHTRQHCHSDVPIAKVQGDIGVFRGWMKLFDELFNVQT